MPEDFQVVKFKDKKITFELLVKPNTVLQFRSGKIGLDNTLFSDDIFTNYSKGEKAKANDLQGTFGTDNLKECAKVILEKGEYNLSTAERKEKVDKKKKEIINYIHKYYTDPRNKTPHPITRIENAFEQIKYNVDPFKLTEQQAQDVVKLMINTGLPLKKSEIEAQLTLKHAYLGQAGAIVKKWCKIMSDSYNAQGATYRITMVPGDYDAFMKELDSITKGDYDFKIEGASAMASTEEATAQKKGWPGQKKKK
jgi:ribosome maturation protein SDO1